MSFVEAREFMKRKHCCYFACDPSSFLSILAIYDILLSESYDARQMGSLVVVTSWIMRIEAMWTEFDALAFCAPLVW